MQSALPLKKKPSAGKAANKLLSLCIQPDALAPETVLTHQAVLYTIILEPVFTPDLNTCEYRFLFWKIPAAPPARRPFGGRGSMHIGEKRTHSPAAAEKKLLLNFFSKKLRESRGQSPLAPPAQGPPRQQSTHPLSSAAPRPGRQNRGRAGPGGCPQGIPISSGGPCRSPRWCG